MEHGAVVALSYTPWPTATPALRATVASAFARAGLPHLRETTARGEIGLLAPGLTWAPTSLSVCLVVEAADANRELAADTPLWSRLRAACSAVRDAIPDLPLGLHVVTTERKTSYAWSPDDAAADVEMAFDTLIESGRRRVRVVSLQWPMAANLAVLYHRECGRAPVL